MNKCGVNDLKTVLSNTSECQVIDVREGVEFNGRHVSGTINLPLSQFSKYKGTLDPRKRIYILCGSGVRACKAAEELEKSGYPNVFVLEGGINSWVAANYPVEEGSSKIWNLDRQVRFVAGMFVLLGIILSYFLNHLFLLISAFVACGLIFSALTNTCTLMFLLSKMPWNRSQTQVRI